MMTITYPDVGHILHRVVDVVSRLPDSVPELIPDASRLLPDVDRRRLGVPF